MDPTLFVAATVSLLATPGPTNMLLATAGASAGLYRSAHLLIAELSGYLFSIALLRSLLAPFIMAHPALEITLRLTAASYLVYLAMKLWRYGSREEDASPAVTFRRVFVTTLLNPKAIIFALTLLPSRIGVFDLIPWLSCLSVLIVSVGTVWITLGTSIGRGFSNLVSPKFGYRFSATALTLLAAMIGMYSFRLA
jgi:threonine/homoserine/homoserine lactone efflux protein